MHQYTFLSPQNSVFHTIRVKTMPGFTPRVCFQEVHNYKNLLQTQLPTHSSSSRRCKEQWTKYVSVRYSALFVMWGYSSTGYGDFQLCACTRRSQSWKEKPYFPFSKAEFPAGAEHSAFLPLTNVTKTTADTLSSLPSDSNVTLPSNVYPSEEHRKLEMIYFLMPNNANLTLYYFWPAQVIMGH